MTWERLVCANCAGPVSEGRCPVCRASRERMQQRQHGALSPAVLAALALLVITVLLVARQLAG